MKNTITRPLFRALALITALMLITTAHLGALAARGDVSAGSFLIEGIDGDTSTDIPDEFGKAEGDGLVWTDKSVGTDTQGDGFDITLSAMAQEYLSTAITTTAGADAVAADVVFILDMSRSMFATSSGTSGYDISDGSGGYYRRIEAMAMATNEAIRIIMNANPQNRVAVYWFGGASSVTNVGTFMEMGSYTLDSGQTDYLLWKTDFSGTIETNRALLRNGVGYPPKSHSTGTGTPTQNGISYGILNTISDIEGADFDELGKRQPFVLLLSDGAAGLASKRWWQPYRNDDGTVADNYTGTSETANGVNDLSGSVNAGSRGVAAATILTAAYMKDELEKAYDSYNEDNNVTEDYPASFYTIGLGSQTAINEPTTGNAGAESGSDAVVNYAWCGLDPASLATGGDKFASVAAGAVRALIATYAELTGAPTGYTDPNDCVYAGFYQFANTYELLGNAFDKLAEDVEAATQDVNPPVVSGDSSAQSSAAAIEFSDKIGEGMVLNGAPKLNSTSGTTDDGGATYTFAPLKSTVAVETDSGGITTLTWLVDAADMKDHMIIYDNRQSPTPGDYKTPHPNPIKLTYNVKLKDVTPKANTPTEYYANLYNSSTGEAEVSAKFTPMHDNPYYYYANGNAGLVGTLTDVGYPTNDDDISHYVKGTIIGTPTTNETYSNIYVTKDMVAASDGALKQNQIGTVLDSLTVAGDFDTPDFKGALEDTIHNCATATDEQDSSATHAFLGGQVKDAADYPVIVDKTGGLSGTADYVSKTALDAATGMVTTLLGNNGRLTLDMGIAKSADTSVLPGGTITYSITVYNYTATEAVNVVVEDTMPAGLSFVENTAGIEVDFENNPPLKWTIPSVPAGGSVTVGFTASVPPDAASAPQYKNKASIEEIGGDSMAEPAVSNETSTVVGETHTVQVGVNKDGSDWDDHGKTIVLKDEHGNSYTVDNDTGSASVPDGSYTVWIDGEETHVTLDVDDGDTELTLNFYTLTLIAGSGVNSTTGSGVYLEGAEVDISAFFGSNFDWEEWIVSGGDFGGALPGANGTITMPGNSLELTALAVTSGPVGGPWHRYGGGNITITESAPIAPAPPPEIADDLELMLKSPKTGDNTVDAPSPYLPGAAMAAFALLVYQHRNKKCKR